MAADLGNGKIKVRFPPSPTGSLHLGGGRTALFNWLFARQHKGIFLFRIEDSDKERSKPEYEANIIEALQWLSLNWDEGLGKEQEGMAYRQSERTATYRAYLEKLLREDKAYWCYCTKEELEAQKQLAAAESRPQIYNGRCRQFIGQEPELSKQVIRLKVHEETIEFDDMIRGRVKFETALIGDFVLAKNLEETPLYNFAVMADDYDMGITHVIRGEDHISNTPKQIVLQRALGFTTPIYGHLPLVLGADRAKLSKRFADVALLNYRDKGYLPEAMVNFLILLGWHPTHDKEVFTLQELIEEFDIARVQKGGAIFNEEKLDWLNREHMKRLSAAELFERLRPYLPAWALEASPEMLEHAIEAVRDRMHTLKDFETLAHFFFELPQYQPEILAWKKADAAEAKKVFEEIIPIIEFQADLENLETVLQPTVEKYGKGNVLWPLRVALSGQEASPDPYQIAKVLGKDETLVRVKKALALLA